MKTKFENLILTFLLWLFQFKGECKFKQWLELESKKAEILQAVQDGTNFPDKLFEYLQLALGVHFIWYRQAEWTIVIRAFYACLSKSPKIKLPIIAPSDEKFKEDDWSYEGRTWHLYSHILASTYGWSLEYISQLQVVEALAKIQEIMTDKQLEKEFQYGLSEIAYPYNPQSKTSTFKPLERPAWMRQKIQPIPRFQIPKSVMPMGVVIADGVLPSEYLPKEIVH